MTGSHSDHVRADHVGADHVGADYIRGGMDVADHKKTFSGFMSGTVYGGALLALIVILPTLVFAAGVAWAPALLVTLIVGIVLGMVLKLKSGWYASLVALAIFIAIMCAVFSAFI